LGDLEFKPRRSGPEYRGLDLRISVTIDDELMRRAQELTGIETRSKLIREALVALVERESSRRLARLGGSEPDLKPVRRRRG
jgi:Arc/MetJ family transcription regulator